MLYQKMHSCIAVEKMELVAVYCERKLVQEVEIDGSSGNSQIFATFIEKREWSVTIRRTHWIRYNRQEMFPEEIRVSFSHVNL